MIYTTLRYHSPLKKQMLVFNVKYTFKIQSSYFLVNILDDRNIFF